MPEEADATILHPTAIVHASARLAPGVRIGPYALVEEGARLGPRCRVDGHAVIGPMTVLGADNRVHHHAVVGTESQDAKFHGERSRLVVGDRNIFREFVTVNRATGEGAETRIGDDCRLMAYSHVAHNCTVGDGVVLSNCAEVGGECLIQDHAILGGLVGVHQFCRIGAFSMIGACSKVTQDVPPFVKADGHPARPRCLNTIGLKRHGFEAETIMRLKSAFRRMFLHGSRLEDALAALEGLADESPEIEQVLRFARGSRRSIARPDAAEGFSMDDDV